MERDLLLTDFETTQLLAFPQDDPGALLTLTTRVLAERLETDELLDYNPKDHYWAFDTDRFLILLELYRVRPGSSFSPGRPTLMLIKFYKGSRDSFESWTFEVCTDVFRDMISQLGAEAVPIEVLLDDSLIETHLVKIYQDN